MATVDNWPDGYGRRVLEEVGSTSDEAARLAPDLAGPCWIMAHRQTAARGRRGRYWETPEGNFAASLVMRLEEPPGQVALRSFVAALALFDACAALTGRVEGLALKWPNDVLLNGGKCAGILLESQGVVGGVHTLVLGIGVNLAHAPQAAALEPGALRAVSVGSETGVQPGVDVFLTALAAAFARWEQRLRAYGFGPVREAWLSRAARLGEEIVARTGQREQRGRFETIDSAGHLVLATASGRITIPAAEVYF